MASTTQSIHQKYCVVANLAHFLVKPYITDAGDVFHVKTIHMAARKQGKINFVYNVLPVFLARVQLIIY